MQTNGPEFKDGKITAGANRSYWIKSTEPIVYEKLDKNIATDVVIVGGGIAGISIAYNLVKAGKKVIVVEDGNIASGETGRTTAHLVTALDDRYYTLEEHFGEEKTKLIAASHLQAIDFIERTVQSENIDCDFERVPGYLFLHPSDQPDSIHKEFEAAKRAGLDVTELPSIPGMDTEPLPCLRFDNQGQFHPLKYIAGLCRAITRNGGQIFTGTHVKDFDAEGVTTDKGFRITAEHVVIATNTPVNNKFVIHLRQYPYRTYVIGARVKKGAVPHALWWDTGDFHANEDIPPYHYVRIQPLDEEYDLLICGGEDHATGLAEAENLPEESRYGLLESWMRSFFAVEEIVYHWSGQVMEPMDKIAYIGRNPLDASNVYIATGDSGNGMTHGTIAGKLITDLVLGYENELEDIYSPARAKLKGVAMFAKEVVNGLVSYFEEKEKGEPVRSLQPGEGKIVEIDGKTYGAYRGKGNVLHVVAAKCTHLGCTVKWNADEQTWDCPCHGSRFTYEGKVVNGPANEALDYHRLDEAAISKLEHRGESIARKSPR